MGDERFERKLEKGREWYWRNREKYRLGRAAHTLRYEQSAGLWPKRGWTDEEYDFAAYWFNEGKSYRQLAYALERSVRSVSCKLRDPDASKRASRDKNRLAYQGPAHVRAKLKERHA